ncbi:IucA/IucC family protein [Photobacterium galatheae]|uniref:N(2)-citryl-N(6)-acetyl-N(6)-hydroxylysine synthase n=1 Tax=Photobacterium galatheae TaxID=1654360 RepID=A0A066RUW5_9GAMM|nr:IucA/IucC family protein [Photobacterium galatheae]KDM91507.1 N(2)-citryl-N(6)-acetyl-N(6)-hydroxylysine synthase [Photobacterium galatheae]MCM0149581.1 N(2)-citryl-N(6)-acetyl-N(6)-hydroxylysine synthase [Photobacterium galatheae]
MKTQNYAFVTPAGQHDVAAACFLNALARECAAIQFEKDEQGSSYLIPLANQQRIRIPLRYFSSLGVHEYQFPAYLDGDTSTTFSYPELVARILEEPSLVGLVTEDQKQIFTTRVLESHHNTYSAASQSPYGEALFNQALNFQQAEQGLLIGHSFHPAPKSREQFSAEDAKKFSPEFGSHFPLRWLAVDQSILISGSSADKTMIERMAELLQADAAFDQALVSQLAENQVLLPAHPWQWQVFSQYPDVIEYLEQGLIKDLGEAGSDWYPTSSTRSLYAPALPYMLKFSLSVKLTNSIRNLSVKEVIRGTRLNQLFADTDIQQVLGQGQGFQLMQEPAYLGLVDKNGKAIDESLVAFRDNPLAAKVDEEAVVLATLAQQNPFGGQSLLAKRVADYAAGQGISVEQAAKDWFSAYCKHSVVSLFDLQANYGVVFLAHQQNIVMQLKDGFPVGMYYRDCQGTGYTDLAFERFADSLNDASIKKTRQDIENYWNQDKVRRYFAYYLIINSTFNVIGAIGAGTGVDEMALVAILREQLEALKARGVRDSACLDYVLNDEGLCCKGNFFCYLQNFNENSIPDPAVIYFDLPNPLINVKEAMYV